MPSHDIEIRRARPPTVLIPKEVREVVLVDEPRWENGVFSARSLTIMRLGNPSDDDSTASERVSSENDPTVYATRMIAVCGAGKPLSRSALPSGHEGIGFSGQRCRIDYVERSQAHALEGA